MLDHTYVKPDHTTVGTLIPKGYQRITALSTSTPLTVPAGARIARIEAEGTAIRWRDDGVAPTASVGMTLAVGAMLPYNGDLTALRLIQAASGAVANISYYG